MSLVTLRELEGKLKDIVAREWQLSLSIDGSQFGVSGNYLLGDLNLRERIFRLDLARDPHTNVGAARWGQAEFASWGEGWKAVLTSIGVLAPRIDPGALTGLLSNNEHLCLIADTGAAASGIVAWLSNALWNRRVELVLNSVVERELFGWSDQSKFYKKAPAHWQLRVKYRLARRLSETPAPNLVVRRPAPQEKAALMLAKLRTPGQKSPDADILLIEQAREVLQTQPPSVRTLYVTSDRAHARSAVALLPPQNVLFAPPAYFDVKKPVLGMAAFWQPAAGFGALHILSLADIVWHLLSTTSKVTLSGTGVEIQIENVLYDNGCPTDWVNPLFDLQVTSLIPPTPPTSSGGLATGRMLLPPIPVAGPPISSAARPTPALMRNFLNLAVAGRMVPVPPETPELPRESFRLLTQLGVIESDGTPLPSSDLLQAVKVNDWDRVHSHLLRSTAYKKTLELLRSDPGTTFSGRPRAQIAFARCLGQVARSAISGPNIVGDRPLSEDDLISFLNRILAVPGTEYPVAAVCAQALLDLGITPVRFEKALQRLLDIGYTAVSLETGGSVGKGATETVFSYNGREIVEDEISVAALRFGGNRPIKVLRRHE